MNLHETCQATVRARVQWNRTGIVLTAGETYQFAATGCWVDFFIPYGPAGGPSKFAYLRRFERRRRVPEANWFTLIGGVDAQKDTAFVIGSRCSHSPRVDGELTCFANDVPGFYWNNFGAIQLAVKRVK